MDFRSVRSDRLTELYACKFSGDNELGYRNILKGAKTYLGTKVPSDHKIQVAK